MRTRRGIMTVKRFENVAAVIGALTLLWTAAALAKTTPAEKCEAAKLRAAAKYAACRRGAEKTAVLKAVAPEYGKCDLKYTTAWSKADTKYGVACLTPGDQGPVQAAITDDTDDLRSHLDGGPLESGAQPLQTGQTQCDQGAGTLGTCPGFPAGQDAALANGASRQYVDNGDGTITDLKTGLMWEKQSRDGTVNDYSYTYTWYNALATKIAALNTMNSGAGFANHTDWRLPNRFELETLVDLGRVVTPAIDPAFNTGCVASCTVTSCSCTQSGLYWSSTTYQDTPTDAWFVFFLDGYVGSNPKSSNYYVRAVRGGS
jgi:hypothetical protein